MVLLALAGCSSTGEDGVKSYDDASKEYTAAAAKLTLPKGAPAWPGIPQPKDGQRITYEDGAGTSMAHLHWLCEWDKEWLSARGTNAAEAQAALQQLGNYPSMKGYSLTDDLGQKYFREDLAAAKLGDPSGIQQYVKSNCD